MPVAKAGKLRASAGARNVRLERAYVVRREVGDVQRRHAEERPQRHGLTSIDATQESLIPWMEFGGRSRGLRDCRCSFRGRLA